jgi:hypothetical protein
VGDAARSFCLGSGYATPVAASHAIHRVPSVSARGGGASPSGWVFRYSARNTLAGSNPAMRRAGSQLANTATRVRKSATPI